MDVSQHSPVEAESEQNPPGKVSSWPFLVSVVIFSLESLAAVMQSGFVVAVLGWEWVRRQTLPAGDGTPGHLPLWAARGGPPEQPPGLP